MDLGTRWARKCSSEATKEVSGLRFGFGSGARILGEREKRKKRMERAMRERVVRRKIGDLDLGLYFPAIFLFSLRNLIPRSFIA